MYALLFPGQGSQSLGMLSQWGQDPLVLKTFEEASERLHYDLWALTQSGPEEKLNQTEYTQPALLTAGVAIYRLFSQSAKVMPAYLAGHSLGEYTALTCAGVIDFLDAVKLVEMRGRFMQMASPAGEGAMAAIVGFSSEQVAKLCQQVSEDTQLAISPANYNADAQTVIAGQAAAVDQAILLAQQLGAKIAKKLTMSVPSHCMLMKPAADELSDYLKTLSFCAPSIPVLQNAEVACYSTPEEIKNALVTQLYYPVRWVQTMNQLSQWGVSQGYECAPGKVLTGLAKRIEPSPMVSAMSTPEEFKLVLDEVNA